MFSPEQTQEFLSEYLAPLEIRSDGTHLIMAWNRLRDQALWWPWYKRKAENIAWLGSLDPEPLHASFMELIKAARTFHLPYRAAFEYPKNARLPLLRNPVLLCCGRYDPLCPHLPQAAKLLPGAVVRRTRGGSRWETVDLYRRFLNGEGLPDEEPLP